MKIIKKNLKIVVELIVPIKYQLYLRYIYLKIFKKLDKEMFHVSKLLQSRRRFVDIGANVGIYSFFFKKSFKKIDSFEPLMEISYRLKPFQNEFFKIHNIALSNKNEKLKFYIPYFDGDLNPACASLELREGKCEEKIVDVRTLDSYKYDDVDLIKIDVEGHEESVILGAIETLKKSSPILIVEIEQRHINKNINDVFKTILDLKYEGFFFYDDRLLSLDNFNYDRHQKGFLESRSKQYINNFIFLPKN